jgi:DNA-directed RNA polymerase subunit RPC12/RpoP
MVISDAESGDFGFECKHCRKNLIVDKVTSGMDINCPDCSKIIVVPCLNGPERESSGCSGRNTHKPQTHEYE